MRSDVVGGVDPEQAHACDRDGGEDGDRDELSFDAKTH
jgi:hypothetical protein